MSDDYITRIERRIKDLEERFKNLPKNQAPGRQAMVATVFNNGAMPTTVPAFYDTYRCELSGTEGEGNAVTISPNKDWVVPVLVLGPKVPEVGDNVIAKVVSTSEGTFWVARRGTTGGSGVGLCGCSGIPTTLNVTLGPIDFPGPSTFTITYTPSVVIPTLGTVNGWVSGCLATSNPFIFVKYAFECDIGTGFFRVFYVGFLDAGCTTPQPLSGNPHGPTTSTSPASPCGPIFSWVSNITIHRSTITVTN